MTAELNITMCVPCTVPPPMALSGTAICIECRVPVWLSPATRTQHERHGDFFIFCTSCAATLMEGEDEVVVDEATDKQLDELETWLPKE